MNKKTDACYLDECLYPDKTCDQCKQDTVEWIQKWQEWEDLDKEG